MQQEETMAADNTEKEKKDNSFMMKLATLIVDKRKGFYLIFIVLCIFCVLSMNKVKVNNDLTTYLPDTTETRRGLDLMVRNLRLMVPPGS